MGRSQHRPRIAATLAFAVGLTVALTACGGGGVADIGPGPTAAAAGAVSNDGAHDRAHDGAEEDETGRAREAELAASAIAPPADPIAPTPPED